VQARVEVDKRQILALLGGKGFCRATHSGHPIQLAIVVAVIEARSEARWSARRSLARSSIRRVINASLLSVHPCLERGGGTDERTLWSSSAKPSATNSRRF